MIKPTKLWKDIAYRFAKQSQCRSRQVGCVVVSPDNRLIGQGYNGAPKGSDCSTCARCNRQSKSGKNLSAALCSHAEANAIGYAARKGISLNGCTMYITTKPCLECAKLIVTAGIRRVIYCEDYPSGRQVSHVFKMANITEEKLCRYPNQRKASARRSS